MIEIQTQPVAGARTYVDVLIVDDDDAVRTVLVGILQRKGLVVESASNGKAALELCSRHEIRLIVTDIFMPDVDGLELIVTVATTWPEMPILAMSGGGMLEQPEKAFQIARPLGSWRTLAKPFELPAFVAAVEELLGD